MKNVIAILIILCFTACYITGCASVPLTGRTQMALVSDKELVTSSLQAYDQIVSQSKVSRNSRDSAMVKKVGDKIITATKEIMQENGRYGEIEYFQWEVTLLDNDAMVNAFCMPGGKIVVFSGILPITQNESGLAVVMGHEVAHAVAKHSRERMSHMVLTNAGGVILSEIISKRSEHAQSMIMTMYGLGAQVGGMLPYSRLQEREADRMGLIFMAKAGYDPTAAISLWERMLAAEQAQIPEFLSTHPLTANRIEQIKTYIPEAMEYYRK
ncbi:MAG: M48 family metallopeptidase [Candidatus Auribacterota bacterium]|nr:M48 family metallopeptidase [Candidatus Auribacterota bacterium]